MYDQDHVKKLYDKYSDGEKNGYLTDDELLEFINIVDTAKNLANNLDAGNATILYYTNMWYHLTQIQRARRI